MRPTPPLVPTRGDGLRPIAAKERCRCSSMTGVCCRDKGRRNGGEGALCLSPSWGDGAIAMVLRVFMGVQTNRTRDKHKAPACAPHRPLSLREAMDCVPLKGRRGVGVGTPIILLSSLLWSEL